MTEQQQVDFCPLTCFKKYINFHFIDETELKLAVDYICGNLNGGHTPDYGYWYDLYSYTSKTFFVIQCRKEKGHKPLAKLGECVCQKKIINFLDNPGKKCNCSDGCASVFFNKVF